MEATIPPILIDHDLDQSTVEEIKNLRSVRAGLARQMLTNLEQTAEELKRRGLMEDVDTDELRIELKARLADLDTRLASDAIFPDEISVYADVLPEIGTDCK